MNYLKKNLKNSSALPYDVMKIIYLYADPLCGVIDKIENKKYDLNTIMYERMKKHLVNRSKYQIYYSLLTHTGVGIEINNDNINDINLKNNLLNDICGYKHFFLWKHKRFTHICGLEPSIKNEYCYRMREDLKYTESYKNNPFFYCSKNLQEIYQEWLKL